MIELVYNQDVELRLLGTFIGSHEILRKNISTVSDKLFHSINAIRVWSAIKECHAKHGHAKLLSVSSILREKGDLEKVGGSTELARIAVQADQDEVQALLTILTEQSQIRSLMKIAGKIEVNPNGSVIDLIPEFKTELDRITSMTVKKSTYQPFNEAMCDLLVHLQEIDEGRQDFGIGTGFRDIDRMLNGMKAGQMIILAARPSLGKTGLAMNISTNIAKIGVPVAFFSLEMSTRELMGRIISSEARAPIRTADDVRDNITALQQAALRIISLPLYIDDTPRLTISEMRTRAIEMQAKHAIKFIVVDYVQIMKGDGQGKGSNREQELAGISKGLKAMAKELGIPILVLAQLNRQAEGKERPNLSQLRESGQLESDADIVAFIHRDRQAQQVIEPGESVPVDIIIEKNRSGRCGVVKLSFVPDFCLFQDEVHSFHEKDSL